MSTERLLPALDKLQSEYEILRELGRGGTSLVYLARERATGNDVAIKLIRAKYIEDEEALARFAREARYVEQLDHPNVVGVRAVRDLGDDGIALVMQHVAGRTLKQVIQSDGPLTPERAEEVLRDVCGALGAAHALRIVHRDVKPENIFIDAETGRALLADFGIARSLHGDTQLTMSGVAIGTPTYMAPEQIDGADLDERADIYSLGLVAWEMLTGKRPWDGASLYAVLYNQKHARLPDVREMRPDIPDSLGSAIAGAIEKDRTLRWQSTAEFVAALDGVLLPRRPQLIEQYVTETMRFSRPTTLDPHAEPEKVATPPSAPVLELAPAATPVRYAEAASAVPMPTEDEIFVKPLRRRRRIALGGGALAAVVVLVATAMQLRADHRATAAARTASRQTSAGEIAGRQQASGGAANTALIGQVATNAAMPATGVAQPQQTLQSRTPGQPQNGVVDPRQDAPRGVPITPSTTPPLRTVRQPTPAANAPRSTAMASAPNPAPPPSAPASAPAPTVTSASSRPRVVVGGMHTCMVSADGRTFCWGENDRGQLGIASGERSATPVLVAGGLRLTTLALGLSHSCAITHDGSAYCWGDNDHGELGDRSTTSRTTPVRVADGHAFRAITAGASHSCALDGDGAAWCWGDDGHGQLGDLGSNDRSAPVRVAGGQHFSRITAGWRFTCGLAGGRAMCWGENSGGQLGDGSTSDRREPVPVRGAPAFVAITAGSAHACGLASDGEVWCWGRNSSGQLGDGTTSDRNVPVRVKSGAHFVAIAAGAVHTCGVTAGGDAYCWGRNTYGQLGDGGSADHSTPVAVAGDHTFSTIDAFGSHTCGVTVSGDAFCWGYNLEGQLGDGTRTQRSRPVYVERPGAG